MKAPDGVGLIAPSRLAVVRIVRVEREARAADGHHVGREGGILGIGRPVVARAGDEGHAGHVEHAVVGGLIAGEDGLAFGEAPAHRHHRHAGLAGGGGHAGHQVGKRLAVGLDQDDLGTGGDGMSPFDVERFLDFPVVGAGPVRVGRGQGRGLAVLIEHRQERRRRPVLAVERRSGVGQPELGVERVEGLVDARVVVGIDDGDGLAGAVQREAVDAVGGPDLGRRVGDRPGGCIQRDGVGDAVAAERQRIDDRAPR